MGKKKGEAEAEREGDHAGPGVVPGQPAAIFAFQ